MQENIKIKPSYQGLPLKSGFSILSYPGGLPHGLGDPVHGEIVVPAHIIEGQGSLLYLGPVIIIITVR